MVAKNRGYDTFKAVVKIWGAFEPHGPGGDNLSEKTTREALRKMRLEVKKRLGRIPYMIALGTGVTRKCGRTVVIVNARARCRDLADLLAWLYCLKPLKLKGQVFLRYQCGDYWEALTQFVDGSGKQKQVGLDGPGQNIALSVSYMAVNAEQRGLEGQGKPRSVYPVGSYPGSRENPLVRLLRRAGRKIKRIL